MNIILQDMMFKQLNLKSGFILDNQFQEVPFQKKITSILEGVFQLFRLKKQYH